MENVANMVSLSSWIRWLITSLEIEHVTTCADSHSRSFSLLRCECAQDHS